MSSGAPPGHPAGLASQFAAMSFNDPPNGAQPISQTGQSNYPRVIDIGQHQFRRQETKRPPIYLGVKLVRYRRPGEKPTWRMAKRNTLPFSSEELAEKASACRRKQSTSKVYSSLLPNLRNQVDKLIFDENCAEVDQAYEWILAALDTRSATTGEVDVILRRDPNPRAMLKSGGGSSYSSPAGNPNIGAYPGATQERGPPNPNNPELRSQGFQGKPPAPFPMPPPPLQQPQQQQRQGIPPQKQPPMDNFGGGAPLNGNQPPPPPPPPPMMQHQSGPPPPPPPPQSQQKAGQNPPFNAPGGAFGQVPPMAPPPPPPLPQGMPQQKNQQQRPPPPPQGGQNIQPGQLPRQKPIVEQGFAPQNHSRGFPHQSYPKMDSSSRRREEVVYPWLDGRHRHQMEEDEIDTDDDEYSSDGTDYTLPSSRTSDYAYEGLSPSRSNSTKAGFDARPDTFMAKGGPRSPRVSSYRRHRRESTDLDHRSLDETRDGQYSHRRSRRYSPYSDENTRPDISRGRDLMTVRPRSRYADDDIEEAGRRNRHSRGPHYRRPSYEYLEHHPRRRHTMHDRYHGFDDSYCGSMPDRSRPTVVYGPRDMSPRRADRRASEYPPQPIYSGRNFYDPKGR